MDVRELEETISIRKGAWSSEEDSILINYISIHGEGHWNHLACNSGLKRTGKSCRLRWKNYLHPNVRRGNFTPEEQFHIIELHCLYGNRWSRIAEFLPGRTDNEIKNYWRTRVQKQAKQLKYDINSIEFREFIRNIWLPTLSEQIHAASRSCHNILEDVIMNSDGVDSTLPDPIQMDHWTSSSSRTLSSDVVEGRQVSLMDHNLSKSDCCFRAITSGLDFGQGCLQSPFDIHSFQGIGNPALFNSISGELSDMLLREDYFWVCP